MAQGWAKMPGEKESDSRVAAECARLIEKLNHVGSLNRHHPPKLQPSLQAGLQLSFGALKGSGEKAQAIAETTADLA